MGYSIVSLASQQSGYRVNAFSGGGGLRLNVLRKPRLPAITAFRPFVKLPHQLPSMHALLHTINCHLPDV